MPLPQFLFLLHFYAFFGQKRQDLREEEPRGGTFPGFRKKYRHMEMYAPLRHFAGRDVQLGDPHAAVVDDGEVTLVGVGRGVTPEGLSGVASAGPVGVVSSVPEGVPEVTGVFTAGKRGVEFSGARVAVGTAGLLWVQAAATQRSLKWKRRCVRHCDKSGCKRWGCC